MAHFYQKLKTILKFLGLLLVTVATSFCSYAQDKPENNVDDIDGLIDELFFDDKQFLDELIENSLSYNFLYTSISYNSNTFFSGRDSGADQFNVIPQVSYYHSSGFNASLSGIYYQEFEPAWDFTSLSLGYFNSFGKNKSFVYNVGYTRFFYSDDFDDFTNSVDINLGIRNKKRTLGTTLIGSYLFGSDESYQIVSNSFANFTLKRTSKYAVRLRPNVNFIIANQSITFRRPFRTPSGAIRPRLFTLNVFNLLNTQISLPIAMTANAWDFELGYNLNIPRAIPNETDLTNTSFFHFSLGYMFDLNKK